MKNSIETIWKEGFLNENSLVAPKINDLYNQKSIHSVDRVKRMFRINIIAIVIMSIVIPIVYYFLDAVWQGAAASILLILTAWYSLRQKRSIKVLDQGVTSLDYLRSFDRWLKDVLLRSERIVRFSYPMYFLIAASTIWSALNKQDAITFKTQEKLVAAIIVGVITLLMFYFSDKIFRWDVRLMYGGVFSKLEKTIAEMETLKQE